MTKFENKVFVQAVTYIITLGCCVIPASCTKWVEPESHGKFIADKEIQDLGGSFTIPLSYSIAWKAESQDKWLSVNIPGYVKGENAITVYCATNESSAGRRNFNRMGSILVRTYDHTVCDTIVVRQKGIQAEFLIKDAEVAQTADFCWIELTSNLTDEERCRLSFTSDRPWVESVTIDAGNTSLLAELTADKAAGDKATVTMLYTPVWGESVKAECIITVK